MKNKSKKRKIIITVCIVLVTIIAILTGLFYIFFMEKDYKFYMGKNMKNVESVEIVIDADKAGEAKTVMIYDKEVIEEIMEKLSENKLKPHYAESEQYIPDKGFSIILYGEEKEVMYYGTNFTNVKCIVDIGNKSNGKMDNGIRSWAGITSFDRAAGEELGEFVEKVYYDSIRNIEISDIKELGKNKEYDWNVFKQFRFNEVEDMGKKVRDGLTTEDVAKFEINGKNAVLYVWYYEGVVVTSQETNEYWLVCDAMIYDEEGNSISIYDEKLDEFLEGLQ